VERRVFIFGPPANATLRKAAGEQIESDAVVAQHFESRAAAISEDIERAGERIFRQLAFAKRRKPIDPVTLSLVIILTFNNVYNVSFHSRFVLCRILNALYFYNVGKLLNEGSKSNDFGARKYLLARCR
jgi:hypothetical protein